MRVGILDLLAASRTTRLVPNGIRKCQQILEMLGTDAQFRAFHEGRSAVLPDFYHHEYERLLGPYASLLSRAERTPEFAPASEALVSA
jgi:hypothetical protein